MPLPIRIGTFTNVVSRAFNTAQPTISFNDATGNRVGYFSVLSPTGAITYNLASGQQFGFSSTGLNATAMNTNSLTATTGSIGTLSSTTANVTNLKVPSISNGSSTVNIGVNSTGDIVAAPVVIPQAVPPGVITQFAGTTAPSDWLFCNGSAVSRSTYSALFSAIGTTYGGGDGFSTFNLPNLQGRVPVGKASSGTFLNLAATGGAETVTLTAAESGMPTHTHNLANPFNPSVPISTGIGTSSSSHTHSLTNVTTGLNDGVHTHTYNGARRENSVLTGGASRQETMPYSATTSTDGGHGHRLTGNTDSSSHSHTFDLMVMSAVGVNATSGHFNLQPYIVLNYIIKF